MYCKNCNAYNDNDSRFCSNCGAELNAQPRDAAAPPFSGEYVQTPPAQPYGQPFYAAQPQGELTKPLSIALPVVALILGIVFADLIGILLGAFALVNFNRYTAALQAGDYAGAEVFKQKSRRLAVIGIVVSVALLILTMIAVSVAGIVFLASGSGEPVVQFNYGDFAAAPFDVPAMLFALR